MATMSGVGLLGDSTVKHVEAHPAATQGAAGKVCIALD
jgi:hypothetical protein